VIKQLEYALHVQQGSGGRLVLLVQITAQQEQLVMQQQELVLLAQLDSGELNV